jgi:hypothetical protein
LLFEFLVSQNRPKTGGRSMRVFAMVFAGLGGTIVMFATWEGLRRRRQERTGQQVRATVVEMIVKHRVGRGSSDMHFPVFEFVAADGRSVRRQSTFGNGTPTHSVGDEIVVWHDPADPGQCDIVGEGRGFALFLALLGFIFLAVGASILVFA